MTTARLSFRPDIEGLRAIAVLLVIGAHAGVPWLAGGFVGVDVFFVISGFLITGLLYQEFLCAGRIDLPAFYARRVRRLLPALSLMVVVTGIVAAALLAPMEQGIQAESALYSAFWASNFFFANHGLNYFSPGVDENLYLHTWSLAAEEQFYLVWPALMLAGLGRWRKRGLGDGSSLPVVLIGATALGFVAGLLQTQFDRIGAFYLLPSRIWQFSLGGLGYFLAVVPGVLPPRLIGLVGRLLPGRRAGFASGIGLACVLFGATLLGPGSVYPGLNALLPTLGAALILVGGSLAPGTILARGLSNPVLTAIGRVSYGWYLWHWPVLILGKLLVPDGSAGWIAVLVLASLALAWLSYLLVERPIRQSAWLLARPRLSLAGGAATVLAVAAVAFAWHLRADAWSRQGRQQQYTEALTDIPEIYEKGCDQWYQSARLQPCFGNSASSKRVVLIGDSVGMQWFPAVSRIFPLASWRVAVLTKSGCPIVNRRFYYAFLSRPYLECESWLRQAIGFVEQTRPDIVVVGSSSAYPLSSADWIDGSRDYFSRMSAAAGRVIVLAPTPTLALNPLVCAARRDWQPRSLTPVIDCSTASADGAEVPVREWLHAAASGLANVDVLSLNDLACPDGVCREEIGGMVVFRDSQHLTAAFVASQTPEIARRIRRIVARPASVDTP